MDDYAQYNAEYIKFFSSQPPVRVCVETLLPADKPIFIEALAYRDQSENGANPRHSMHVQGMSHWAPANIGPYSQCVWVSAVTFFELRNINTIHVPVPMSQHYYVTFYFTFACSFTGS